MASQSEIADAMRTAAEDLRDGWPVADILPAGWTMAVELHQAQNRGRKLRLELTFRHAEHLPVVLTLHQSDVLYLRPYCRVIDWARAKIRLLPT